MPTGLIDIGQLEYEKCIRIMKTLTKAALLKGCRVFEKYGMDNVDDGELCFVGYMFDNDWGDVNAEITCNQDLEKLYYAHYYNPEIVFLAACEVLEEK